MASHVLLATHSFSLPLFPLPSLLLYTFYDLTIFFILTSPTGTFCSFFPFIILCKTQSEGKQKEGQDPVLFCFVDMSVSPISVSHDLAGH